MVTIVASWDARTSVGQIHMSLDGMFFDTESRLAMARQKVKELEASFGDQPIEVMIASARSVEDFRKTDPRFYGA